MSYDVNHQQSFSSPAAEVSHSALEILTSLGGKVTSKTNPAKGQLEADFNKKISGQMLNNRCQLRIKVTSQSPESCQVMAKAYPIDPMGQKLAFGVQGNAAQIVIDTFFQELTRQVSVA